MTPRTRVIYLSHTTSPTALTFPLEEICRRAREAGILSVIDAAHVPGQRTLSLDKLGADFYTGNEHKSLFTPKNGASHNTGLLFRSWSGTCAIGAPSVRWS